MVLFDYVFRFLPKACYGNKPYILPISLGNCWIRMSETTTYYEDKVYLPKGVREKLGLIDGDVLHIEVVEKGVAKLSVVRRCRKATLAREMLKNPPNLGRIKGRLLGEEIYEDIT